MGKKDYTLGRVVIAAALGMALGFAGARILSLVDHDQAVDELAVQLDAARRTVEQTRTELDAARARVDSVHSQLAIEEGTRKGLQSTLQTTQAELGRARDQLAFFDELLPPGPDGAVSIRAFQVERHGATLQYRILLMRNAPEGSSFDGEIRFEATGMLNGRAAKMPLLPAVSGAGPAAGEKDAAEGRLALNFDQFQRRSGLLSIPSGFMPESVVLNVLEGNIVRVSRKAELPPAQ